MPKFWEKKKTENGLKEDGRKTTEEDKKTEGRMGDDEGKDGKMVVT